MSENLRKGLGIDDWLELVKEDKNLNSAYISFAQYMYILEKENQKLKEQLKQRDEAIDELIEYLKEHSFDYGTDDMIFDKANAYELLKILQKYKGDNNE